ncbi:hypothetical protein DV702_15625 [Sporosarcina sp. PTS2304]|nr:hypothetical protein DV702_15625 [Sporosarcina sp. PTS2304]
MGELCIAWLNAYVVISFSTQFIETVIVASNTSPLSKFKSGQIVSDNSTWFSLSTKSDQTVLHTQSPAGAYRRSTPGGSGKAVAKDGFCE